LVASLGYIDLAKHRTGTEVECVLAARQHRNQLFLGRIHLVGVSEHGEHFVSFLT
jgi:hypothetical protein